MYVSYPFGLRFRKFQLSISWLPKMQSSSNFHSHGKKQKSTSVQKIRAKFYREGGFPEGRFREKSRFR